MDRLPCFRNWFKQISRRGKFWKNLEVVHICVTLLRKGEMSCILYIQYTRNYVHIYIYIYSFICSSMIMTIITFEKCIPLIIITFVLHGHEILWRWTLNIAAGLVALLSGLPFASALGLAHGLPFRSGGYRHARGVAVMSKLMGEKTNLERWTLWAVIKSDTGYCVLYKIVVLVCGDCKKNLSWWRL